MVHCAAVNCKNKVLGKMPPGKIPPGKMPLRKVLPGILHRRNLPPGKIPPGKLPLPPPPLIFHSEEIEK